MIKWCSILLFTGYGLSLQTIAQPGNYIDSINYQLQQQSFRQTEKQHASIAPTNSNEHKSVGVSYPDIHYEFKIAALDGQTPINLVYNQRVEDHIHNFAVRRKRDFENIIGLSQLYFPIFEEMLDKYNLPLELKYLAVIESGLNPLAVSRSGAVGLWQFKLNSGKMFDLRIDSYVDERRDPYKATEAACKYLTYLYRVFKDWQLVITAYNGGPGEIREAIYKAGGNAKLEELIPFFPEQTKNYFAAFVAAYYVMEFYNEHGLIPKEPDFYFFATDTVTVNQRVHFEQIEKNIDISVETLRFLNPVYKKDVVPEAALPARLTIPANKVPEFLLLQDDVYATALPEPGYLQHVEKMNSAENKIKMEHVVAKGEFFHLIAMKYQCSIENIKAWNNLEDHSLHPGQKLIIWVEKDFITE